MIVRQRHCNQMHYSCIPGYSLSELWMDTFSHSQASDWEALCTALILTSLLFLHNDDDDDDDAGRDRDVNDARNANFGDPALVWHVLWDPTKMREKVDNDRAENQDDDHRDHETRRSSSRVILCVITLQIWEVSNPQICPGFGPSMPRTDRIIALLLQLRDYRNIKRDISKLQMKKRVRLLLIKYLK